MNSAQASSASALLRVKNKAIPWPPLVWHAGYLRSVPSPFEHDRILGGHPTHISKIDIALP